MIALWLASVAAAGTVGLDRVDLLAEAPSTWLNHELPRAGHSPRTAALRFVQQVQPVFYTPIDGLTVATSLSAQTLHLDHALVPRAGLSVGAGLQTQLLLPTGLLADVGWRQGPLRVGVGVSALSSATWRRPDWTVWTALPAVGIGIGRNPRKHIVWMGD